MIRSGVSEETSPSFFAADLTPLIDVVFIVMVFLLFMANVQILSVPVNLPEASREEAAPMVEPKTITVSILDGSESWALEDEKFAGFESMAQALLVAVEKEPETVVLVAGDKTAPLGNLVQLMVFFSEHNITAAQVLMEEGDLD